MNFLDRLGKWVLNAVAEAGDFAILCWTALRSIFKRPFDIRNLFKQLERIGVDSMPVVLLTALFTGMVIALQTYSGFKRFQAQSMVGALVGVSLTRELAPVLAGLMVSGRIASAIAAEIGTMRVTEQVDALEVMGVDPVQYLFVPRILSGTIMMPLLVGIADVIGIYGGF
ncbi:MAG: ABC transporter permease, partial [Acidobacteria bacterium]